MITNFGVHRSHRPRKSVTTWQTVPFFGINLRNTKENCIFENFIVFTANVLVVSKTRIAPAWVSVCYGAWEISSFDCLGTFVSITISDRLNILKVRCKLFELWFRAVLFNLLRSCPPLQIIFSSRSTSQERSLQIMHVLIAARTCILRSYIRIIQH